MGFKTLLIQEQSSFAKNCIKKGGFFKCCIQSYMLNIFETSRNSLIEDGLIKAKPTSMCKPGWGKKDPCFTCHADAICTKMDILTGRAKHKFYKGYKKEHRVGRKGFSDTFDYRLGDRTKLLTLVLASDCPGAMSVTFVT